MRHYSMSKKKYMELEEVVADVKQFTSEGREEKQL